MTKFYCIKCREEKHEEYIAKFDVFEGCICEDCFTNKDFKRLVKESKNAK